jgi:hypothetical protein
MNAETGIPEQDRKPGRADGAPQGSASMRWTASSPSAGSRDRARQSRGDRGRDDLEARREAPAQLDALEPSITMIGQVKAGKTSLVNAMVGWPDLLPADVNPWTSVVTSLHLSPEPPRPDASARASASSTRANGTGFSRRAAASANWPNAPGTRTSSRRSASGRTDAREVALAARQAVRAPARPAARLPVLRRGADRALRLPRRRLRRREGGAAEMQGRFADITKSADLRSTGPNCR